MQLATLARRAPALLLLATLAACSDSSSPAPTLKVGVAAVPITPCGQNPDWDGPITANGVWGETYVDQNGNGRYDTGEPFTDDERNDALDPQSHGKYDGIYMAGFGNDRVAVGCHDDIWARALVIDDGQHRLAMVALDLVGTLKYGSYYGFAHAQAQIEPALGITDFIFASTHDHQGPDALGLWGSDTLVDGKFPLYLAFIDRETARAVREAVANLTPVAEVRPATTNPEDDPELRGLQVRTRCRPPFVFDTDLRAIQFLGKDGATIATLLNWGTHPESLEDGNTLISSDFVNYIRDEVEQRVGGRAVYFSADLGSVEITGDTCVGGADPRNPDGSNEFDKRDDLGYPRTERIGRAVGGAAARALGSAHAVPVSALDVKTTHYRVPGSNATFELGRAIGILDLDPTQYDPSQCPGASGLCGPAEQTAVSFADSQGKPQIQLITFPGELFPELYMGVADHHRTDCPAANTGRPFEPAVLPALTAPFRLVVGLSPDEIGYIVPGYDFHTIGSLDEAPDPCQGNAFDPTNPNRHVPSHYHETLSIGIEAGSFVTCKMVELLQGPEAIANEPACTALP